MGCNRFVQRCIITKRGVFMITIKDYAKEKNVSYEAVRKQISRYKNELNDHIVKKNRTQYLDDYAISFLNDRRKENAISIINTERTEYIKELENDNRRLYKKIELLQEQLLEAQKMTSKTILLESNVNTLQKENDTLKTQNLSLQNDLDSFKPSILGFYRKK